jgi:hypothetical protein
MSQLTIALPGGILMDAFGSVVEIWDGERRWRSMNIAPQRPTPLPEDRESLMAIVESLRTRLYKEARTAGVLGRGVRVDSVKQFAAYVTDELKGDYVLPTIGGLWIAVDGLNPGILPRFCCEPETGPDALHALNLLAECLGADGAEREVGVHSGKGCRPEPNAPSPEVNQPGRILYPPDEPEYPTLFRSGNWDLSTAGMAKYKNAQMPIEGTNRRLLSRLIRAKGQPVHINLLAPACGNCESDSVRIYVSKLRKHLRQHLSDLQEGNDPIPYADPQSYSLALL